MCLKLALKSETSPRVDQKLSRLQDDDAAADPGEARRQPPLGTLRRSSFGDVLGEDFLGGLATPWVFNRGF